MAVLAQWSFTGNTLVVTSTSGVTASAISAGAGITATTQGLGYASAPVLNCAPTGSSTTESLAITNNCYFQFTITPVSTISISSITFNAARGGSSSPRGWSLRSNNDTYGANLGTSANVGTVRTTWEAQTVTIADSAFQNRSTAVTFRCYVFTPGSGIALDVDDVAINGTFALSSSAAFFAFF